jgi:class 3 adenylate cyclase
VRDACLHQFSAMAASLAIPLVYQGRVTGVLTLGQKKSGHFYSREDIELLTTMANQAAVAIENASAHEEVVRYAEELEASLRRIQLLESIKTNLAKFVPRTVQELIEESPEAPSLEKREIDCSVLFADITGYTRLSAQMEMDQVNKLVERYFSAFLDEILNRGGDVNETAGDGLMVIFRKKDPRRHARAAVLVALGIQRRTQEINEELRGQYEPIAMKVGVNSGIAAVGATRIEGAAGTRWTYTASGPTTNVAARLAALAEGAGGSVIISEETRARLTDEFRMDDLGPLSLKNVPHPIRAFRVTGREEKAAAASQELRDEPRARRRLYIVSSDHREIYEDLQRRFEGVPNVEVVLDRRVGDRRQPSGMPVAEEQRRADRRSRPDADAELRSSSHVVVEIEIEPQAPSSEPPGP